MRTHRVRAAISAVACASLAACSGPQSALHPAGPAAASIAQLWWVMCIGALLVFALVLCLFGYAMLRRKRGQALRRPHGLIVFGGLVLPTTVLIALLVYGVAASRVITGMDAHVDHVIEVQARMWQWEFRHRRPDGSLTAPTINRVTLPSGRMIEFRIGSDDVIHSFWIPRLGGKIDAIPGRTNVLRLRAERAGPIRGQCAEFCGLDHAIMDFEVHALAPADYAAWLQAHALPGEARP